MESFEFNFEGSGVPEHMKEAIANYITNGWEPGSFMFAVLTNDLAGAVVRADYLNRQALSDIVAWLMEYAPADCWGNRRIVEEWMEKRRKLNAVK